MATEVDRTENTTEAAAVASDQAAYYGQTSNPITKFWFYLRRYPIIPVFILLLLLFAAIVGPYVAPFPRDKGFSHDRNLGLWERSRAAYVPLGGQTIEELSFRSCDYIDPNGGVDSENIQQCGKLHIFGADHTGRDIFSRLLHGSRISIAVVTFSLTSGMILGTAVALFSGYYGGILDEVVTRFVDVWNALPFLMVAIVVTQLFGAKVDVLLWQVDMLLFVLMLVAWVDSCV